MDKRGLFVGPVQTSTALHGTNALIKLDLMLVTWDLVGADPLTPIYQEVFKSEDNQHIF